MTAAEFAKTLYVGWGDLDANGHMRNTAGWLDLRARKLVVPPDTLRGVMERVPRTAGFREVASLPATTG